MRQKDIKLAIEELENAHGVRLKIFLLLVDLEFCKNRRYLSIKLSKIIQQCQELGIEIDDKFLSSLRRGKFLEISKKLIKKTTLTDKFSHGVLGNLALRNLNIPSKYIDLSDIESRGKIEQKAIKNPRKSKKIQERILDNSAGALIDIVGVAPIENNELPEALREKFKKEGKITKGWNVWIKDRQWDSLLKQDGIFYAYGEYILEQMFNWSTSLEVSRKGIPHWQSYRLKLDHWKIITLKIAELKEKGISNG